MPLPRGYHRKFGRECLLCTIAAMQGAALGTLHTVMDDARTLSSPRVLSIASPKRGGVWWWKMLCLAVDTDGPRTVPTAPSPQWCVWWGMPMVRAPR